MKKYRRTIVVCAAITGIGSMLLSTAAAEEGRSQNLSVTFSGLVELEAAHSSGSSISVNDTALATVELGVDARISPWVNVQALLLFEEEMADSTKLDEGTITVTNPDRSSFFLAAGRMVVPFGDFESRMISDSLTLELGESHETALQLGFLSDGLHGSLFFFNGDADNWSSDGAGGFGFDIGLFGQSESGGFAFDVGLSGINSLTDSDLLQEKSIDAGNPTDKTPGIGLYAIAHSGPFSLIGEYLAAMRAFDIADLTYGVSDARPAAFNLEVGYAFDRGGREINLGAAWQGTRESLALDLPEFRYLASLSMVVFGESTLSFEYAHDQDYPVHRDGNGEGADTFIVQLAVSF